MTSNIDQLEKKLDGILEKIGKLDKALENIDKLHKQTEEAEGTPDANQFTEKLDNLAEKLKKLGEQLGKVESVSQRMDTHIDFVNQCYVAFRFPLEVGRTIMTRVAPIFGIEDARGRSLLVDKPSNRYDKIIRRLEASALPYLPEDQLPRNSV